MVVYGGGARGVTTIHMLCYRFLPTDKDEACGRMASKH